MLNDCRCLLRQELLALCGWNVFRHTKDKKQKRRWLLLAVVGALLIVMAAGYVALLTWGLILLWLGGAAPAWLAMLAALLVFFFGVFKAGGILFAQKDYDMLCAMPLRTGAVLLARLAGMYLRGLALTLLILLPGTVVYGVLLRPQGSFYLVMLVGAVLLPVLPLALSAAVGTAVYTLASRLRHRSLAETVLMLLVLAAAFRFSFSAGAGAENLTAQQLANLAATVTDTVTKAWPPAVWLCRAAVQGELWPLAAFAAVSLAAGAAVWAVAGRCFHRVCRALGVTHATHSYRMGVQKAGGLLPALFRREAKRYFASGVYVTNTIVGPVLGCVMAAGLLAAGPDSLQSALPVDITRLLPYVLGGVCGMMTPAAVSLSMEGAGVWRVKTLPITFQNLQDAKLLFSLCLQLPFYLVSQLLLTLALRPGLSALCLQLLVPAVHIVFSAVAGFAADVRLHDFDWQQEVAVVKQSASALVGGMLPALAAFGCGAVAVLCGSAAVQLAVLLAVAALAAALYRACAKTAMKDL